MTAQSDGTRAGIHAAVSWPGRGGTSSRWSRPVAARSKVRHVEHLPTRPDRLVDEIYRRSRKYHTASTTRIAETRCNRCVTRDGSAWAVSDQLLSVKRPSVYLREVTLPITPVSASRANDLGRVSMCWVGWTKSLQPRTYFFNHLYFLMMLLLSSNTSIKGTQILGSILYLSLLRPAIFACVQSGRKLVIFHFNSWLSFRRLCRLLWGYQLL